MHVITNQKKEKEKSVHMCQVYEVKLFFSRLRVSKQVGQAELYVSFANFFRLEFFLLGIELLASFLVLLVLGDRTALRFLGLCSFAFFLCLLSSHPPPGSLWHKLLEGNSGPVFAKPMCTLCLNRMEDIIRFLFFVTGVVLGFWSQGRIFSEYCERFSTHVVHVFDGWWEGNRQVRKARADWPHWDGAL